MGDNNYYEFRANPFLNYFLYDSNNPNISSSAILFQDYVIKLHTKIIVNTKSIYDIIIRNTNIIVIKYSIDSKVSTKAKALSEQIGANLSNVFLEEYKTNRIFNHIINTMSESYNIKFISISLIYRFFLYIYCALQFKDNEMYKIFERSNKINRTLAIFEKFIICLKDICNIIYTCLDSFYLILNRDRVTIENTYDFLEYNYSYQVTKTTPDEAEISAYVYYLRLIDKHICIQDDLTIEGYTSVLKYITYLPKECLIKPFGLSQVHYIINPLLEFYLRNNYTPPWLNNDRRYFVSLFSHRVILNKLNKFTIYNTSNAGITMFKNYYLTVKFIYTPVAHVQTPISRPRSPPASPPVSPPPSPPSLPANPPPSLGFAKTAKSLPIEKPLVLTRPESAPALLNAVSTPPVLPEDRVPSQAVAVPSQAVALPGAVAVPSASKLTTHITRFSNLRRFDTEYAQIIFLNDNFSLQDDVNNEIKEQIIKDEQEFKTLLNLLTLDTDAIKNFDNLFAQIYKKTDKVDFFELLLEYLINILNIFSEFAERNPRVLGLLASKIDGFVTFFQDIPEDIKSSSAIIPKINELKTIRSKIPATGGKKRRRKTNKINKKHKYLKKKTLIKNTKRIVKKNTKRIVKNNTKRIVKNNTKRIVKKNTKKLFKNYRKNNSKKLFKNYRKNTQKI